MSVDNADRAETEVQEEKKERLETIDFKMVTFSLAGKEYGIDIMNVKEIANAGRFTYVPNAAPFVRGVYNLRGDIISIIDLRTMFHLPAERKNDDSLESLLILKVNEHAFGVIVDNIDKVVGVSQAHIQPPHPIFGDINVKYIKGIIENHGKLYIIINVEKLFAVEKPSTNDKTVEAPSVKAESIMQSPISNIESDTGDVNYSFVQEALFSYKHFGVTNVNKDWYKARYKDWVSSHEATDIQLKAQGDAEQFLESFYSKDNGVLWQADYAEAIMASIPKIESKSINVWNPGCGKGFETYSFVCALKNAYPDLRVKVWANDSDLLAISMAPNMVFSAESVPDIYLNKMTKGKNGWVFQQQIRDSIFFEFHDVLNTNPIPPVDFILCRDTVSFMSEADQNKILSDFDEKSKANATLIFGTNETLPLDGWRKTSGQGISIFIKTN